MASQRAATKPIRVATIGYGGRCNMGGLHLRQMEQAGMTPVAVAELDEKRLVLAAAERPGIRCYHKVADLLRDPDVDLVAVITPHNTHAELALRCLQAGKHVVCEKPMAITTADCDRMIAAAKRNRLLLTAYHNRHWDGIILRALRVVQAGTIGDLVSVRAEMRSYGKPQDTWRGSRSISGGILYDWGVHLLEYGLQLIDDEMVEVSGFASSGLWAKQSRWRQDTIEDEATAIVRFRRAASLTLRISGIDPRPCPYALALKGSAGVYRCDLGNGWELSRPTKDGVRVQTGSNPQSEWHRFYANIAAALRRRARLIITPEWARRPIHILDLARRSARQNKTLKVKYR